MESLTPRPPSKPSGGRVPRRSRTVSAKRLRSRTLVASNASAGTTARLGQHQTQHGPDAVAAGGASPAIPTGAQLLASAMGGSAAAGAKSNQARAPTHTSAAGRGTVLPSVAAGGRTSKQNRARNEAHLAPFRKAVKQSLHEAKRRGTRAFNAGRYGESTKWFSEALMLGQSAPSSDEASTKEQVSLLLHRASAWAKLGNYAQAVEDSDMALSLQPFAPRALIKKGEALLQLKQYADASHAFMVALERNPHDEVMRRGFYDSLRGLRLGWHQYCPSFSHTASGPYSVPSSESGVGPTRPSTVSGTQVQRAGEVNASNGIKDVDVACVLQRVGALCNFDAIMDDESQHYRSLRVNIDMDAEREAVVGVILEFRDLLRQLFAKYCNQTWRNSAAHAHRRASSASHTSPTRGTSTLKTWSNKVLMNDQQFWQFCVDCGLVTRTFNRQAVQSAWTESLRAVGEVTRRRTSSSNGTSTASYGPTLFSALPSPIATNRHTPRGQYDFQTATTLSRAFPTSFPSMPLTPRRPTSSHPPSAAAADRSKTTGSGGGGATASSQLAAGVSARATEEATAGIATALFPKFIEAIVRLAVARYRPQPPPSGARVRVVGARTPKSETSGMSRFAQLSHIGGGKKRGGSGLDDEFVVSGTGRRLKFALERHLLSNALLSALGVDGSGVDTTGTSKAVVAAEMQSASWAPVLQVLASYRPRLRKVFFYFAAADRGSHRHMDIREFLYMLKSLSITDERILTLEEAARVVVSHAGFIGDPLRHKLDFNMFCEALARCADVKTFDGVMPAAARLDNFLVGEFFQKIRSKTTIASLWL